MILSTLPRSLFNDGRRWASLVFNNCKNLDELKKAYKAAAMKNHPDMGGDTATMQAINAEYEARFEVLKRGQNTTAEEDETGRTQATTEASNDFIDHLLHWTD